MSENEIIEGNKTRELIALRKWLNEQIEIEIEFTKAVHKMDVEVKKANSRIFAYQKVLKQIT